MDYLIYFTHPCILGTFGLFVGSFLNVVIHRMPLMMERNLIASHGEMLSDGKELQRASEWGQDRANSYAQESAALNEHMLQRPKLNLAIPRSRCPHCGHQIKAIENIPVLSWLFLRGKCSSCKSRISVRYPLVELFTGASFAVAAHIAAGPVAAIGLCAFAAILIALAGIDWDTTLLPDDLTLPLMWLGIALAFFGYGMVDLQTSVLGAAIGYLSLWSLYWVFKLLTGREGMGYGDFKLLAAIGAWLGWSALPVVAVVAAVIGLIASVVMKFGPGLREGAYVPFGPFLALGAVTYLVLPAFGLFKF